MRLPAAYLAVLASLLTLFTFSYPVQADSSDRLQRRAETLPLPEGLPGQKLLLLDITRAGERLVAVGEQGIILLSDDAGQHWRQAQVPVAVLLTAVQFIDERTGWAVGHDGVVLHSADGGEQWHKQLDGNAINQLRIEALQQAMQQPDRLTGNGGLPPEDLEYALEDAQIQQQEGPSVPLLDLWFKDRNEGYVTGAYGMFLSTQDGGNSWQSLDHQLPNPDRLHFNSIHASRNGTLYLAGEAGTLLRRLGRDWQQLDSGYEGSLLALHDAPDTESGLYLMGLRGHLFYSADGERWQPRALPTRSSINAALTDAEGRLILLGLGGLLLQQQGEQFQPLAGAGRSSFSAAVVAGPQLILVGDAGLTRVNLNSAQSGGDI
ncbi:WD40/YVTN/BNR-like repeat-containing protein [Marinobacterium jannaschii]|uniref:WD40/YVTN/BNR-like repeat-containing protein n=1 Tax=Marinobacterium jannaschii TaxID=64970 RepID=UPI000685E840|nr:YCF48-related protein [Marinobacterium jannaschii]